MQVSIHEAKAKFSHLIQTVESGEEVVVSRRKKPVARLVPIGRTQRTRIGGLAGRSFRMGKGFDDPDQNAAIADDFGIPRE